MNREETFECKDCGHQFPNTSMDYEEEDLCIWCAESDEMFTDGD